MSNENTVVDSKTAISSNQRLFGYLISWNVIIGQTYITVNIKFVMILIVKVSYLEFIFRFYSKMESILECSICELQSVRIGKHYGAITCYPCRSFFRRTPERKRTPRCKFGGSCLVYHTVKTHCPGCRYKKCLRWVNIWIYIE